MGWVDDILETFGGGGDETGAEQGNDAGGDQSE